MQRLVYADEIIPFCMLLTMLLTPTSIRFVKLVFVDY